MKKMIVIIVHLSCGTHFYFMDIKGGELKKLSQKNVFLEIVLQKISLVISCSIVQRVKEIVQTAQDLEDRNIDHYEVVIKII